MPSTEALDFKILTFIKFNIVFQDYINPSVVEQLVLLCLVSNNLTLTFLLRVTLILTIITTKRNSWVSIISNSPSH